MHLPYDGVILLNVGSPASPRVADVASYLRTFLTDENVISLPWIWRQILVRAIIVPFRKGRSAKMYKRLWYVSGGTSPLLNHMARLAEELEHHIAIPTVEAMRYGDPSVEFAVDRLRAKGGRLKRLLLVPLFPQFALSCYHTAVEHAKDELHRILHSDIRIDVLPPYYASGRYISAVCDMIRPSLRQAKPQRLFLSFHSIPIEHWKNTPRIVKGRGSAHRCNQDQCSDADVCYRYQCEYSAGKIAEALSNEGIDVEMVYQSQMGHRRWLGPSLKRRLRQSISEDIRRVAVVVPGLSCDCLETIDEIGIRAKHYFLKHGGDMLILLPSLNSNPVWVRALSGIIQDYYSSLSGS